MMIHFSIICSQEFLRNRCSIIHVLCQELMLIHLKLHTL